MASSKIMQKFLQFSVENHGLNLLIDCCQNQVL